MLQAGTVRSRGTTGGTTGGATGSDAQACFNPLFGTIGTRIVEQFRSTPMPSGATLTTDSDTLITREMTFNGNAALEAVSEKVVVGSEPNTSSDGTTTSYTRVDAETFSSRSYGLVDESNTAAGTITTTVTIDPFLERRFDLDVGESFTQTYTTRTDFSSAFIPDSEIESEVETTYLGVESVTVPAGTFDACKFEERNAAGELISTNWYDVGSGVQIKQVAPNTESVWLSASVNGTPID